MRARSEPHLYFGSTVRLHRKKVFLVIFLHFLHELTKLPNGVCYMDFGRALDSADHAHLENENESSSTDEECYCLQIRFSQGWEVYP